MRVRRAALSNSALSFVSSAANVLLVPFLLGVYGIRTYGSLSLLTAIAQYFAVLDFGFSNALVRYKLREMSLGDTSYRYLRRRILLWFTTVGGVLILLAAAFANPIGDILNIGHVPHLWLAVGGAGSLTLLTLIGNCYNSALVAKLRYIHLNLYNIVRHIGSQIVIVVAYVFLEDLATAIAFGVLFVGVLLLGQILLIRWGERSVPTGNPDTAHTMVKRFVTESAEFSAQSIANALVIWLLQAVIGVRFGPESAGLFDIARRVLFAIRRLIDAAFEPVFARASDLFEKGMTARLSHVIRITLVLSVAAAGVYYVTLRLSLGWILRVWLNEAAPAVEPIAQALLLGVALSCIHLGVYHVLRALPHGRRMNTLAGVVASATVALGFTSLVSSVHQVLIMYALGVSLASVLTIAFALRLMTVHTTAPHGPAIE
jgi:O-antigen/teichoic acid export membrane protein